jgi:hypothetical protein
MLGKFAVKAARFGKDCVGIFFRRSREDLKEAIERSDQIYRPIGARWYEQKKQWRFPSGARLKFEYLDRDADANNYQGHNYTDLFFEEITQWGDPKPINKLRATLRSAVGVPCQFHATGNPGGPGHNWVKQRFIDPAPQGYKVLWEDFTNPFTGEVIKTSRVFIPSKLPDNKFLGPGYVAKLYQAGDAELVRAWLEGDWDVVAGGMFDDVWATKTHVLEPFDIPSSWRIDRSFDWGSSKPFSVGWWAESDGSEVRLANGQTRHFPPGTLFRIAEWYGWNGKANEGLRLSDNAIASGIKSREEQMRIGRRVRPGPADSSIFDEVNGDSPAKQQERVGVRWEKADKSPGSRKRGWQLIRNRLIASKAERMEKPGLFVFSTCQQFIRTVPSLPRLDRDPDDIDTEAEDHIADETRYRVSAKTRSFQVQELRL